MKRHHLLLLTGCLLSVSLILAALYAFSPLNREIYRASFERKFASGAVIKRKAVLDLKYNSFYIAGSFDEEFYLGNATAPFLMIEVSKTLADSQHVRLNVELDSIRTPMKFSLSVDSPYFYLTDGRIPEILRGNTTGWQAEHFLPDNEYYFVEAVSIGPSTFVLRSYNTFTEEYELAKRSPLPPYIEFNRDLLIKQVDGIFCVDGKLHYNKLLNRIVYLYYYRNEYIVADTNLNLLYRAHTIDTFSTARIEVAHINSDGSRMLRSPPLLVNGKSCVYGESLFIQSGLLAKNEDVDAYRRSSTIDVYDLTNGTYSYSFHVPKFNDHKPKCFQVFKNHLVAIYSSHLVLYELRMDLRS